MSDSGDEDFKRAIALSLGEADPLARNTDHVIAIESDEEGDAKGNEKHKASQAHRSPDTAPSNSHESNAQGIFGLNRKKMEEERLARKRKASPPSPALPNKTAKTLQSPQPAFKPSTNGTTASPVVLQYPQGAVKKTWALGHTRDGQDIKLEEVLQKNDLQLAVFSSFQWDTHWLFSKLNLDRTRVTLVMQAKELATREQYVRETQDMKNLRLCFPNMEGQINCMHSKMMLLSYPKYLRIVVPTANLVPYDWGEDGTMENMVFMVDLPRLEDGKKVKVEELTSFGKELVHFLSAKGIDASIVNSVCSFDFTATKSIALVHTIGGAHTEGWQRTGWPGLGSAVDKLGLATNAPLKIDFVTSSVGSLNINFLSRLYKACQGETGATKAAGSSVSTTKGSKGSAHATQNLEDALEKDFRIYFPTHETVKASTAGAAGTICIQSKYYENPKFPGQFLRDCQSIRPGLLMHNKIIYVQPQVAGEGKAWTYIGSANCSESAWGNKLVTDRVTKATKLNCRNWECGVIVPVAAASDAGIETNGDKGLDIFTENVPVPMKYPGEEYGGRKPWYFMEQGF